MDAAISPALEHSGESVWAFSTSNRLEEADSCRFGPSDLWQHFEFIAPAQSGVLAV